MANLLLPGDQAPWFHAPALAGNPRYAFDTAAGRPILLLFAGRAAHEATANTTAAQRLRAVAENRHGPSDPAGDSLPIAIAHIRLCEYTLINTVEAKGGKRC